MGPKAEERSGFWQQKRGGDSGGRVCVGAGERDRLQTTTTRRNQGSERSPVNWGEQTREGGGDGVDQRQIYKISLSLSHLHSAGSLAILDRVDEKIE